MARILVADDDGAIREFVSRALTHEGHRVDVAVDGGDALRILRERSYDLLLTDIMMPVMDGIALALKVAKDWPETRILLMTGYAAEKQRAYKLDVLVHEVIAKPFTMQQICRVVAAALKAPPAG